MIPIWQRFNVELLCSDMTAWLAWLFPQKILFHVTRCQLNKGGNCHNLRCPFLSSKSTIYCHYYQSIVCFQCCIWIWFWIIPFVGIFFSFCTRKHQTSNWLLGCNVSPEHLRKACFLWHLWTGTQWWMLSYLCGWCCHFQLPMFC